MTKPPRYLFILAASLAACTFFLMLVGGIVHGTGSSLACPDWPTCYGTFFPEMKGGIFFEHSHRLLGAFVGTLTVLLCIGLFLKKVEDLKWWGLIAVFLVIFQGVLGGVTVLYRLPTPVSTAHLATSMLFLALTCWLAFRLGVPFIKVPIGQPSAALRWILGIGLILLYLQIVLGALMRHSGAGLACLEIPFCQGSLWPEGSILLKMHMTHRLMAYLVALYLGVVGLACFRSNKSLGVFHFFGLTLVFGVFVQILLGFLSVHTLLGLTPVTAHLALAALLWVNLWVLFFSNHFRKSESS